MCLRLSAHVSMHSGKIDDASLQTWFHSSLSFRKVLMNSTGSYRENLQHDSSLRTISCATKLGSRTPHTIAHEQLARGTSLCISCSAAVMASRDACLSGSVGKISEEWSV